MQHGKDLNSLYLWRLNENMNESCLITYDIEEYKKDDIYITLFCHVMQIAAYVWEEHYFWHFFGTWKLKPIRL